MKTKVTRRQFGKIVLVGAGIATVGVTQVPRRVHAQGSGYYNRLHGPVLTNVETIEEFEEHVRAGGHTVKKVVTWWGLPGVGDGWSNDQIEYVCYRIPGETIVRTTRGDGVYLEERGSIAEWAYPLPDAIEAEITPWYEINPDIWIQIGNEPNNWHKDRQFEKEREDQTFIDTWAGHLNDAILRCKDRFPGAKIITSPMAPLVAPARYFEAMKALPSLTPDIYIGFNALNGLSFHEENSMYSNMLSYFKTHFSDYQWFIMEYGMNRPYKDVEGQPDITPADKGRQYAEMMHFANGENAPSHLVLPDNVVGGVYYHIDTSSLAREPTYHIGIEGANAYRERIGPGSFSNFDADLSTGYSYEESWFYFEYAGASRSFRVDVATSSDMSSDLYADFGTGDQNPVVVVDPTKWDKYVYGQTVYWRVTDEWGVQSPVQSAEVHSGGT